MPIYCGCGSWKLETTRIRRKNSRSFQDRQSMIGSRYSLRAIRRPCAVFPPPHRQHRRPRTGASGVSRAHPARDSHAPRHAQTEAETVSTCLCPETGTETRTGPAPPPPPTKSSSRPPRLAPLPAAARPPAHLRLARLPRPSHGCTAAPPPRRTAARASRRCAEGPGAQATPTHTPAARRRMRI